MSLRIVVAVVLLAGAPGMTAAQEAKAPHAHAHAAADAGGTMPLMDGLGDWSWPITTRSPSAQQYFDQGLRLAYAFHHDEAVLSFREALRLDPSCAMCAWGVAYALSPNINMPMAAEAEADALAAIRQATALAGRQTAGQPAVTTRERDVIAALATRFGEPTGADRAARDSAYATAMRRVASTYPNDEDVQVLFADAMLNLRPWNQWTRAGTPQPGTLEVVATLERVLARTPDHAGACHFYVHTVEASPNPERALDCARRLPELMPAAGHVVHMPAHVYLRVGMYEEAARANIAAVEADHGYFAMRDITPGIYPLFYAPHNLHFLWAAYTLSGQRAKALEAAQALVDRVAVDDAREEPALQAFLPSVFLTHLRFGDWSAALAAPAPPPGMPYVQGMWHYARGVAHAATGDLVAAALELDALRAIEADVPADVIIILNAAPDLLRVARLVLDGRIAAASGDTDRAVARLYEATAAEDALTYDEPPPWYEPVRQVLGAVLLDADRAADAEAVFRADLQWVRENGWSLRGLERALHAQGRTAEAAAVAARLQHAWQHADVTADLPGLRVRFRRALLPTGTSMRFAEAGAGEPVVFIHGFPDSWFSWSRVLAMLPPGLHLIAPDLRGHGDSRYDGSDYSMTAMATDIAALLDRLGIDRATIVGHSMGVLIAQALASDHPGRVSRLVLVGAAPSGNVEVLRGLRDEVSSLPQPVPAAYIRDFQMGTVHTPVAATFMDGIVAESGRATPAAWRGASEGMVAFDYSSRLAAIDAPTLIVWGAQDAFFPEEMQQALLRTLARATLLTYADTGHSVHWERPRRFAEDLAAFVTADLR
jgi:pimeloyl-ACP methyl ester carboxylesterase/tetratricopeptide (TPR) repeat protein